MTRHNNDLQAFFTLAKAGLWEQDARLFPFNKTDFKEVYRLAEEQSVIGLVAAGLEHVIDVKIPKEDALTFVGSTMQLEQRNHTMNAFAARLIDSLRKEDVYTILVKGQGIAQCYERPLWRASGDIDFLFNNLEYEKAKKVLTPLAVHLEREYKTFMHFGMIMQNGVVVELHGTLHSRLSKRVDKVVDEVQKDIFYGVNVRSWQNGKTSVFLPSPDNDVIIVFTHILHHYYIEGIGLRQICDWCRLLWTYKGSLNHGLLESRIRKAGLMSEWRAFAAVAVDWLGMPIEAMPLYSPDRKWSRKANRIIDYVLETGNFGHNRPSRHSKNRILGKIESARSKMKDFGRHALIFPLDSAKFIFHFIGNGIKVALEKES